MIKKIATLYLLLSIPFLLCAQEFPSLILTGHKAGVNVCSFSPDGKRLMSGSKDGVIRVWDVTQHYKMMKEFSFGDDAITALHFNHAGDKFSVGSLNSLQIFNSATFKRIVRKKNAHVTFVKSGNFSIDDQLIVSSSWKENALVVWDASTLKKVMELAEPVWTDEASFTPDGKYIISCNHDNMAKVWDVKTGNIVKTFAGHTDWIYAVKVTSDMTTLITGSFDQSIKLWEFSTGKLLHTLTGHKDGIAALAVSPNNQMIASASVDGVIIVWDLTTQQEKFRLADRGSAILQLEFSPDGKSLVASNFDGTLRVWDLSTAK